LTTHAAILENAGWLNLSLGLSVSSALRDVAPHFFGELRHFGPVDRTFPVIIEARPTVQRALSVPIEGRRAGAALGDGLGLPGGCLKASMPN
jgi:hypothetical protein